MKLLRHLLLTISFFLFPQAFAQNAPSQEPVVGKWMWQFDHFVTINADGSASSNKGARGTWTPAGQENGKRKYRFVWDGKYVDIVTEGTDEKTLEGIDGRPVHFVAYRLATAETTGVPLDKERLEDKYFAAREKFQDLLRECKQQSEVDRLCNTYGGALAAMRQTPGTEFLQHELTYLDEVRKGFLANPNAFRRIRLDARWYQKADEYKNASADFNRVTGLRPPHTTPPLEGEQSLRPDLRSKFGKGIKLFGADYLCPLEEFITKMPMISGLKASKARVSIGAPGFPRDSLYYHSYDVNYQEDGIGYNRLMVVTDSKDQVVALQFVAETPNGGYGKNRGQISIFNFVQFRRDGSANGSVAWGAWPADSGIKIKTCLWMKSEPKEVALLYLPAPTLELVRYALAR